MDAGKQTAFEDWPPPLAFEKRQPQQHRDFRMPSVSACATNLSAILNGGFVTMAPTANDGDVDVRKLIPPSDSG